MSENTRAMQEPSGQQAERARTRRRLWRAAVSGSLAVAVLVAGADLGGLHALDARTRLLVASLAVVFVGLGVVATRAVAEQLARAATHSGAGAAASARLLGQLAGYLMVFLATLGLLTIPLQQLLLGSALTGVIFGIAAQQPLSNLIAGIVLLLTRPLRAGQRVIVHSGALGGPIEATVTEFGLNYTSMVSDGELVHIPNSGLLAAVIRHKDP